MEYTDTVLQDKNSVVEYSWLWKQNQIYLTQAEATLATKYASSAEQGILELGRGGSTVLLTHSSNVPVISVDSQARVSSEVADALKKAGTGQSTRMINEATYKINMSGNTVDVMLVGQNINPTADGADKALVGLINHYWPNITNGGHALFYNYKINEKTHINTVVNLLVNSGRGKVVDQAGKLVAVEKLRDLE